MSELVIGGMTEISQCELAQYEIGGDGTFEMRR